MISLYHLLAMLTVTVIVIELLSLRTLQKNFIRCLISFAFFGGIVLLIGLTTIPISKADCEQLVVKELKFMQAQKKPSCDPDDPNCNTEK
jgi:hypothetical protein